MCLLAAKKIRVLAPRGTEIIDTLTRAHARMLIECGDAIWAIVGYSIRPCAPKPSVFRVSKGYVPDKMPPREVPNTKFVEPSSDSWIRDHRTMRLEPCANL